VVGFTRGWPKQSNRTAPTATLDGGPAAGEELALGAGALGAWPTALDRTLAAGAACVFGAGVEAPVSVTLPHAVTARHRTIPAVKRRQLFMAFIGWDDARNVWALP
jgi:hypothetical protein